MCAMSIVMARGIDSDSNKFRNPIFLTDFEGKLRAAKEYDIMMGQEDCELDEKRQALKKIADEMGVEIKFP